MSIDDLISFESKQLVFKSLNNQAPQYICNLFQRNSDCSSQDLRNTATDLRLPMNTSLNGQKRLSYRGAKLWNALANEVKQAPSLSVFKEKLLLIKILIRIFTFFFHFDKFFILTISGNRVLCSIYVYSLPFNCFLINCK